MDKEKRRNKTQTLKYSEQTGDCQFRKVGGGARRQVGG